MKPGLLPFRTVLTCFGASAVVYLLLLLGAQLKLFGHLDTADSSGLVRPPAPIRPAEREKDELLRIWDKEFLRDTEWDLVLGAINAERLQARLEQDPARLWRESAIAPSLLLRLNRRAISENPSHALSALGAKLEGAVGSLEQKGAAQWGLLGILDAMSFEQLAGVYAKLPPSTRGTLLEALPLVREAPGIDALVDSARMLDSTLSLKGAKAATLLPMLKTYASVNPQAVLRWLNTKDGSSLRQSKEGQAFRDLYASAVRMTLTLDKRPLPEVLADKSLEIGGKDLAQVCYRNEMTFEEVASLIEKLPPPEKQTFLSAYGSALAQGSPQLLARFVAERPALDLPKESVEAIANRLMADLPGLCGQYLSSRPGSERVDLRNKSFRNAAYANVDAARAVLTSSLGDDLPKELEKKAVEMVAFHDLNESLKLIASRPSETRPALLAAAYIYGGSAKAAVAADAEEIKDFVNTAPEDARAATISKIVQRLSLADPKKAAAFLSSGVNASDADWIHFLKTASLPEADLVKSVAQRMASTTDEAAYGKLAESLVTRYAQRDAASAANAALELPPGPTRSACMDVVTRNWVQRDATGALDFLRGMEPGESRDSAVLGALKSFDYLGNDRALLVDLLSSDLAKAKLDQKAFGHGSKQ